jgi:uncharacterized protein (TIGR01777 family)
MNGQHIVLAGGSGFLGRSLMRALKGRGCQITVLTRSPPMTADKDVRFVPWDGRVTGSWTNAIDGADAIVNFTGKNVNCRPNERNWRELAASRREAVIVLADAVRRSRRKPGVFVQCSAVGVYGDTESCCDEQTKEGDGRLAEIAKTCEAALHGSDLADTRKVVLRLGVVLGRDGGALPLLARLTRCYLGGAAGSGKQYMSWIHAQDLNRIVVHTLNNPDIEGTFNAVSPMPARNAEFMRTLRKVLGKPWCPPTPAVLLRAVAFAMGFNSEVILTGQRCAPCRLQEAGFYFEFDELEKALQNLIGAV